MTIEFREVSHVWKFNSTEMSAFANNSHYHLHTLKPLTLTDNSRVGDSNFNVVAIYKFFVKKNLVIYSSALKFVA